LFGSICVIGSRYSSSISSPKVTAPSLFGNSSDPDGDDSDGGDDDEEEDVNANDAIAIVRSYHVSIKGTSNHPTTINKVMSDISATLRIPSSIASTCSFVKMNFFRISLPRPAIVVDLINSSFDPYHNVVALWLLLLLLLLDMFVKSPFPCLRLFPPFFSCTIRYY